MALSRIVASGVAAMIIVVAAGSSAQGEDIPPDVALWFADTAPALIEHGADGAVLVRGSEVVEFGQVEVGTPEQISTWSSEYIGGSASPVTELQAEWVAPVSQNGSPVGTVRAYRPDPARVNLAYYDDDTDLAQALWTHQAQSELVYDAPLSAYFSFDGESIAPLTSIAKLEISGAVSVPEFQALLAERYGQTSSGEAPVGGGATIPHELRHETSRTPMIWSLAGVAVAGLAVAGVLAVRSRTRKMEGEPS